MAAMDGQQVMRENEFSPVVEGNLVHTGGETHILNYDTNVLSLDNVREPTELTDGEDNEVCESDDEDEDIELSPGGILDEETIGRNLSNLGRSADGSQQVFLHVTVAGFSLKDISALAAFVHLQKVELPYNELTDLAPLSSLQYMLILDVSHNKLTKLLDFTPPKNLREANFGYNEIEEMTDLSAYHYISSLNLDHNKISKITGLAKCTRLQDLSLAHNKIEKIHGLENLPIQSLNLCHNHIKKIENLETLHLLRIVNLAGNNIRSLAGLEDHSLLENVDLEDNEVIDISEMKYIKDSQMLRQLNLLRNPIQELPDYRLSILFRMKSLTDLDRHRVEVEEKVAAVNMFNPPAEIVAARDHIMHVVYSFLQPSRILDNTLPSMETPYPMLVLVGPQGSGKKDLALKLVDEFSDYFGYCVTHTTRKPHKDETPGKDYRFVDLEKFEFDIRWGQFIQTHQYHGHWYGLQMQSIEDIAREGLACVVHMELEGVLTLKNTYFEPRYVLIMPLSSDCHEKRLRERGLYSESQIESNLERAEMYQEYNRNHPGFFDMMINSDDIEEAYRHLRRLVMDYLGISIPSYESEVGDITETKDTDNNAPTGTQLGTRTWSRPSIPDSMSQQYTRGKTTQSPVLSGRGILEEMSLKRRHSAARASVAGYIPPLFEQITSQYPKTAPQTVDNQVGLDVVTMTEDMNRSQSAPVNNKPTQSDEDTSDDDQSDSSMSMSSAGKIARSPEGSIHNGKDPHLPTETMNPMELSNPRPPSVPRPGSRGRPGSDRHKVLPPINQKGSYVPEY
ncbi:leucine-rich repeat and guanylate kinase domain-containing protein-like [Ostrea edulis]|uniref:leucine-rich repeat and guanylate kinase domain-containing protein-like n=1 Tax=Ostrea edulis TaxID=37623 RepID=UPI002094602D|nr:leucine-rich repeat and guanylate kinase domain-containing protein-like [Ostrea edulis]